MTDLSKVYNMIWTAGFQSGLKVSQEVFEEKTSVQDIQKRADELIKEDAEGIMTLLKLENDMKK